jgi:tRNA-uridine 2-sulfurtransferase
MSNIKKPRALSLISGGLDSMLATKLVLEQGIEVEGINFFTGFTGDHNYYFKRDQDGCHSAQKACDQLGIKLHVVDIVMDFKQVLLCPKYGYGANLNPCIDCKLFMITNALAWMEKYDYDFLITGEVLGQRPMSQRKHTLPLATKITSNLIVRPLSAKLLAPTLPEINGWINRELLGDISGRGRQAQMKLAAKFGLKEYPQPGGGCVLTDSHFCERLQDLLDHRDGRNYGLDDILLLRLGRHIRINQNLKAIVGRDEVENNFIEKFSQKYTLLQTLDYPGALTLLDGMATEQGLLEAAKIAVRYSKGSKAKEVRVRLRKLTEKEEILTINVI